MPALHDQAIVLRLVEYSETSQVVSLLTAARGRVQAIAKGVRRSTAKRFATGLDLLEYGEVSYAAARGDRQLATLTEWRQRGLFPGLRRELGRVYGGLYAAELILVLTQEEDPHEGLFGETLGLLAALEGAEAPLRAVARFQQAFLRIIGFAPQLAACTRCGRPRPAGRAGFFSAATGGLLCRDCAGQVGNRRQLPAALLDTTPASGDARGWFELQDYYLMHLAERGLRLTRPFLRAAGPRP